MMTMMRRRTHSQWGPHDTNDKDKDEDKDDDDDEEEEEEKHGNDGLAKKGVSF